MASLGMRFYTGDQFPDEYRGQIFIAEHGSWNRDTPIGYRIAVVRLQNNTAIGHEIFAEGWLQNGTAWGRPVDVQLQKDGSLLVSDDLNGVIYRISSLLKGKDPNLIRIFIIIFIIRSIMANQMKR